MLADMARLRTAALAIAVFLHQNQPLHFEDLAQITTMILYMAVQCPCPLPCHIVSHLLTHASASAIILKQNANPLCCICTLLPWTRVRQNQKP